MLKARHQQTGEAIISVDLRWAGAVSTLRDWSQRGLLRCPGCQQPVLLRAGQHRIWHFAHQHKANCTYGEESLALLQARASLYRWLQAKYANRRGVTVTVEHDLQHPAVPRPVDVWVAGHNHAYWLIEQTLKPDLRDDLLYAFRDTEIPVQWLFLRTMLRQDNDKPDHLHLTTTERDLLKRSPYDEPHHPHGQSIHYLDSQTQRVLTIRGAHLVHPPQQFTGTWLEAPLEALLLHPRTGELVHPGEPEQLEAFQAERQARRQQLNHQRPRPITTAPTPTPPNHIPPRPLPSLPPEERPARTAMPPVTTPVGQCVYCGQHTSDWWDYDGKTGTCKCNDCLNQRRSR